MLKSRSGEDSNSRQLNSTASINVEIVQIETEETAENAELWQRRLKIGIAAGRRLDIDVDSRAENPRLPDIVHLRRRHRDRNLPLWEVDEPDEERDLTEEEEEYRRSRAVERVPLWLETAADLDAESAEAPAPSPSVVHKYLPELTSDDSATFAAGDGRQDSGYSIYRKEIDQIEQMREQARASLPPRAT